MICGLAAASRNTRNEDAARLDREPAVVRGCSPSPRCRRAVLRGQGFRPAHRPYPTGAWSTDLRRMDRRHQSFGENAAESTLHQETVVVHLHHTLRHLSDQPAEGLRASRLMVTHRVPCLSAALGVRQRPARRLLKRWPGRKSSTGSSRRSAPTAPPLPHPLGDMKIQCVHAAQCQPPVVVNRGRQQERRVATKVDTVLPLLGLKGRRSNRASRGVAGRSQPSSPSSSTTSW